MKREIPETVYLTVKTDAKQPIKIRTLAEWCFIDWGDESYSPDPLSKHTYRIKGEYKIKRFIMKRIGFADKICNFIKEHKKCARVRTQKIVNNIVAKTKFGGI